MGRYRPQGRRADPAAFQHKLRIAPEPGEGEFGSPWFSTSFCFCRTGTEDTGPPLWGTRCLRSSPAPKSATSEHDQSPQVCFARKTLGCHEPRPNTTCSPRHEPARGLPSPLERENQPRSRQRAGKRHREGAEAPGRQPGNPEALLGVFIANTESESTDGRVVNRQSAARGEGQSRGVPCAGPLPGEVPAGFSLMSKQDLVNSRSGGGRRTPLDGGTAAPVPSARSDPPRLGGSPAGSGDPPLPGPSFSEVFRVRCRPLACRPCGFWGVPPLGSGCGGSHLSWARTDSTGASPAPIPAWPHCTSAPSSPQTGYPAHRLPALPVPCPSPAHPLPVPCLSPACQHPPQRLEAR